jgi:hypothetical protein
MEQIVRKFIEHALSGEDILNICNNKAVLHAVSKLKNFNTIDDVLGQYGACILLYDYPSGEPGHWSCIFKRSNNVLEFFCPYGLKPDDANDITGGPPYLTYLINKSRYHILYNDYQLQTYSKSVNVCGRYVGMRLQLRDYPLREFIDLFTKNKHYNSDFWITTLTLFCEN